MSCVSARSRFSVCPVPCVAKSARPREKMPAVTYVLRHGHDAQVRGELRNNTYDAARDVVVLNAAQLRAWRDVATHYRRMYTEPGYTDLWSVDYITDATDVEDLAAFFFWGAWLCAARRPGEEYSYTHNWPYDPLAGNLPTPEVMLWSAISILVLPLAGRGRCPKPNGIVRLMPAPQMSSCSFSRTFNSPAAEYSLTTGSH